MPSFISGLWNAFLDDRVAALSHFQNLQKDHLKIGRSSFHPPISSFHNSSLYYTSPPNYNSSNHNFPNCNSSNYNSSNYNSSPNCNSSSNFNSSNCDPSPNFNSSPNCSTGLFSSSFRLFSSDWDTFSRHL